MKRKSEEELNQVLKKQHILVEESGYIRENSGLYCKLDDYAEVKIDDGNIHLRMKDVYSATFNGHTLCFFYLMPMRLLAASINEIKNLKSLDLSKIAFEDDHAKILAPAIKNNKTLKTIDITDNKLTAKGHEIIKDATKGKSIHIILDNRIEKAIHIKAIHINEWLNKTFHYFPKELVCIIMQNMHNIEMRDINKAEKELSNQKTKFVNIIKAEMAEKDEAGISGRCTIF